MGARLGASFTFYTSASFCVVAIIGIALSPATPNQGSVTAAGAIKALFTVTPQALLVPPKKFRISIALKMHL